MVVYATNMQLHVIAKNLPKTLCKNSPKNPQKSLAKICGKNLTKIWYNKNFYIFLNIQTKHYANKISFVIR